MTTETAQAFWITGPGNGEIRPAAVPELGAGDVEVETRYTAVSRGTESLVFAGKVPASEYERMRAPFQEGRFPAPIKYGYINVGHVVGGDERLLDRDVFCLYPHQTRYVVPADAVTPIPDTVPAARAVLAANLETAVNGLWDAAPAVGDRIAVIGAGTVGCIAAWLGSGQRGAEVELIDINPRKSAAAAALGVRFALPEQAARDADVVIDASGTADGLELALSLAGFEAKVVVLSWFGSDRVALPLGGTFHSKRLKLVSSQVAHVAGRQRGRWDRQRRMALVMRLLEAPELDALISGESRFDELPAVMRELAESGDGVLCHRIAYR